MLHYWRRLMSLGLPGLVDLGLLGLLGILAEVGIRSQPLPRVVGWFGLRLTGPPSAPCGRRVTGRQLRRWRVVEMLMRHWPFGDRAGLCLRRSLLLGWVLRDRDPLLRVGVGRIDGTVTAHAWLEFEGSTLGDVGRHQPLAFDPAQEP
jgi:hypothetical protein